MEPEKSPSLRAQISVWLQSLRRTLSAFFAALANWIFSRYESSKASLGSYYKSIKGRKQANEVKEKNNKNQHTRPAESSVGDGGYANGTAEKGKINNKTRSASQGEKQSVEVRLWRALWRRRRNVLSKDAITIILTAVIAAAAWLQYTVYSEQASIMRDTLQQNERTLILGKGQLAITARSFEVERRRAEDMEEAVLQFNGGGEAARDNVYPLSLVNAGKFTARTVQIHIELSLNAVASNKTIRPLITRDISAPEIIGQKAWTGKLVLPLGPSDWENLADTKEIVVQSARFQYENGFDRIIPDSRCQIWAYFRTPQDALNPISGRGTDCDRLPELLAQIQREKEKH